VPRQLRLSSRLQTTRGNQERSARAYPCTHNGVLNSLLPGCGDLPG
jgi:hypothetical protein